MVGFPDAAVRESRERVKSALSSCSYGYPWGYTTISLAPADVKKEGAAFALPIALGMMAAISDLNLSARAYDRILRVARTLADLEPVAQIASHHISEAGQDRTLDRLAILPSVPLAIQVHLRCPIPRDTHLDSSVPEGPDNYTRTGHD